MMAFLLVCYGHILEFYFKKPRFQVQSTVAPHKCGIGQFGRIARVYVYAIRAYSDE